MTTFPQRHIAGAWSSTAYEQTSVCHAYEPLSRQTCGVQFASPIRNRMTATHLISGGFGNKTLGVDLWLRIG